MIDFPRTHYRDTPLFKDVAEQDWNNWKWQFRNVIRDIPTLKQIIHLGKAEEKGLEECLKRFRMAITPYYAVLMDKRYRRCVIRLQAVPTIREIDNELEDSDDPLHEDVDSPVPGITHRYPDRVLFRVTHICSMYCRHCTRRRTVGVEDQTYSRPMVDVG